mgnify:CR=1 FL=1
MSGTTAGSNTLDICTSTIDTYSYWGDTDDCTDWADVAAGICEHHVRCYCPKEVGRSYNTGASFSDETITYSF